MCHGFVVVSLIFVLLTTGEPAMLNWFFLRSEILSEHFTTNPSKPALYRSTKVTYVGLLQQDTAQSQTESSHSPGSHTPFRIAPQTVPRMSVFSLFGCIKEMLVLQDCPPLRPDLARLNKEAHAPLHLNVWTNAR